MLASLLKLERPLVVVDLETTGTNVRVDRIVQIAAVKVYPDGRETRWSSLVNPGIPIPKEATDVHSVSDEMVQGCRRCGGQHTDCSCEKFEPVPTFRHLAPGLAKGFAECDFCGYNVSFDLGFLAAEFARTEVPFKQGRIVDAFAIFKRFEPRNLKAAVMHYCSEEFHGAHDAMNDVDATIKVLSAQLQRYENLPRNVGELHDLFFKPAPGQLDLRGRLVWRNGVVTCNFGEHTGKPLKDMPRKYLEWLASPKFQADEAFKKIVNDALRGVYPAQVKP